MFHPSRLLRDSLLGLYLFVLTPPPSLAATPIVSIVIDDLGNNLRDGRQVLALPAPIALAVLPHTAYSRELAEEASRAGREVLLHLPMDAENDAEVEPGPGRLELDMSALEMQTMLAYDLETVPHAIGVNNHMGSRFTQSNAGMETMLHALKQRRGEHGALFFLDSRTSPHSVAARVATKLGVPLLERDVFLDNERGEEAVRHSIERAERLLGMRGQAIVIGHPHPETLAALERWLPSLAARGIRVVPLSVMLAQRQSLERHADADRPAPTRPGL